MEPNSKSTSSKEVEVLRVFIDTEFTDFTKCELISIGAAASEGSEFYGESLDFDDAKSSDFVRANIYPLLKPAAHGMKRSELSARLWCWLDELPCKKFIIAVDYQTDYTLLHQLLDFQVHPKQLAVQNIFSEMIVRANQVGSDLGFNAFQQHFQRLQNHFAFGVQEYFHRTKEIPHHSLSDARANREGYQVLINEFGFAP